MDEQEGDGEPQATAVQLSCEKASYQAEEPHRLRSQNSDSWAWKESLDRVRRSATRLKSVVMKPDLPAASTVSPAT